MSTTVQALWALALALAAEPATADVGDASGSPNASQSDEIAMALQQGYLANREAFREFICRFEVKEGKAETTEDALGGNLSNVVTRNGIWVVDGRRQRYELICEDPKTEAFVPPAAASVGDKPLEPVSIDCISEKHICDGVLGLIGQRHL